MTKSINDFKTLISAKESLSNAQLFNIKGGDGDDKRRDCTSLICDIITTSTTTTTTTTTKPSGK